MPAGDLLVGVEELLEAGAEYYTSVQTIIPLAAISEIAFTQFYERLVRRRRSSGPNLPARLRQHAHQGQSPRPGNVDPRSSDLAGALESTPSAGALELLRRAEPPAGVDERPGTVALPLGFTSTVTVYRLQPRLREPVPADDPAPLLDTLGFYVKGEGGPPRASGGKPPRVVRRRRWRCARVWTCPRQGIFDPYSVGAKRAPMREDALSDVGLAWPLMRRMLLEMGHRLRDTGAIEKGERVLAQAG